MMGRQRTGTIKTRPSSYQVALPPLKPGGKHRYASFPKTLEGLEAAERYRRTYLNRPAPDPNDPTPTNTTATARPAGRTRTADRWLNPHGTGHRIDLVANAWVDHHYLRGRNAEASRVENVRTNLSNIIIPWFHAEGVDDIEQIDHELFGIFTAYLDGTPRDIATGTLQQPTANNQHPPDTEAAAADDETAPFSPRVLARRELGQLLEHGVQTVTLTDAATICRTSQSTLKRRHRDGHELPGWTLDNNRRVRIPINDLLACSVLADPNTWRGPNGTVPLRHYNEKVAGSIIWAVKQVLKHARRNGIELLGDPTDGIRPARPDRTGWNTTTATTLEPIDRHENFILQRRDPHRIVLDLQDAATIATELHIVHQLALWILRLIGPRPAEAYGVLVQDILDAGDRGGLMRIGPLGGRMFPIYNGDGQLTHVRRKEVGKTDDSHRIIVIPHCVMELIRLAIDLFHTDPDTGAINLDTPLIPALKDTTAGGLAGLATAVHRAAEAAGIPRANGKPAIKLQLLRASLISDLTHHGADPYYARRYVGHAVNDDEHERAYTFDPNNPWLFEPTANLIDDLVQQQLGRPLLQPTTRLPVFGHAHPLRQHAALTEAALTDLGHYLPPHPGEH